ncbi:MAG: Plasma membrane t-SNARE, secretory vesicle fusion [Caeruleum heppii]|nr:MAG: Plasma membrane t-SNARE, secretory vesicle fusion [Caeruleum heppii]
MSVSYGNGGYGGGGRQDNPYGQQGGNSYGQQGGNPYGQQGGNPYGQQGGNPYGQQGGSSYGQQGGDPYRQQSGNQYGQQQASPYSAPDSNPYAQQASVHNRPQGGPPAGQGGYGGGAVEMDTLNGRPGGYGQGGAPGQAADGYGQPMAGNNPNAILDECRQVDTGIDSIEKNLQALRTLQQRSLGDPNSSQQTATNRELDRLSSDTMALYRNFATRVKNIKSRPDSGSPKNAPQVGKVDRRLKAAINQYQNVEREFRQKLQQQLERQYRIVRPDATEAEVREAVEDTSNNQVFSQALMNSDRRGQSQTVLRQVSDRHEAIQKIERQMIELAQMFQDMETLVVQQEPAVQAIEQQGEQVTQDVGKANEEISGAIVKARSRNRKKWWCLLIVVIILILIAAGVAVLFATGDVMAQQAVEKVGVEKHNLARTGRMALYGGAVFGPAATTWFKFLQNKIRLPNKNAEIVARVAADQSIFATTNLFCFLSSMSIMEGSDPKEKLEKAYWPALQKNWMVWPLVQAVNFKLVPLEHRVLVVNVVSLGWNCYLSYINSQKG